MLKSGCCISESKWLRWPNEPFVRIYSTTFSDNIPIILSLIFVQFKRHKILRCCKRSSRGFYILLHDIFIVCVSVSLENVPLGWHIACVVARVPGGSLPNPTSHLVTYGQRTVCICWTHRHDTQTLSRIGHDFTLHWPDKQWNSMPFCDPNQISPTDWRGGGRRRRMAKVSQPLPFHIYVWPLTIERWTY